MIEIILHGILLGLLLSVLVGATFFVLIETSISRGGRIALAMAIGIILSDLFCIIVAYLMTSEFIHTILEFEYLEHIAGLIFLAFGVRNVFFKKVRYLHVSQLPNRIGYFRSFVKGIVFNLINPAVIAFWLGAIILVGSKYHYSRFETFMYFGATLGTIFCTDIIKIYFSRKLRRLFTNPTSLKRMHQIIGVLLIFFGIGLILHLY